MSIFTAVVLLATFVHPAITEPSFPDLSVNVADYGAKPDGSDATLAFRNAIEACAVAGGGHVIVPAGTYFTGPVHLKSNIDFHLDEGAVLDFSDDPRAYLPAVPSSWEGLECWNYSPLVYAYGCTNVALTGCGLLRPRMAKWEAIMEESKADIASARALLYKWGSEDYPVEKRVMPEASVAVMRPQLVQFNRSKDVLIEGVRIKESPFWTIHLFLCDGVIVRNVEVDAHGFNNDGIDVEMTRNVLVDGGVFSAGDDGFVFKSGRNRDGWRLGVSTENVLVRNAHVRFAHSLLCVGSEMSAGVRNICVENCRLDDCYNLFYVKTNARRGGFVDRISLRGVKASKVETVLHVDTDVLYQWRTLPTYEERITKISGLRLENVDVGLARNVVLLQGDGRNPIDGVTFVNVAVKRTMAEPIAVRAVRNMNLAGLRVGRTSIPRTSGFINGESVVFVGDSITHGGGFESYLQLFQSLRQPGCGTRIMNFGISGDDARGANTRLKEDIVSSGPDCAFVMFGMNDVGRHLYSDPEAKDEQEVNRRKDSLDSYSVALRQLVTRLEEDGIETVLMTPTPYDQYGKQPEKNLLGCNEPGLSDCAEIVRTLACERRIECIDLHAPLTRMLKNCPESTFCRDRVHPNSAGHLIVAAQILESLKVSPLVADFTIDADAVDVNASYNARVSELHRDEKGLAFVYAPLALPFPKWADYETVEGVYPLTDRLNREMCHIRNLANGTYVLEFDGAKVGTFTAEDFGKGVNLAVLDTPNQRRACELLPVVENLKQVSTQRRYLVLMRQLIREEGVDPRDAKATSVWIDRWLSEKERGSCFYYWADNFREWNFREDELIAKENKARAMLDGVRPAASKVRLAFVR